MAGTGGGVKPGSSANKPAAFKGYASTKLLSLGKYQHR